MVTLNVQNARDELNNFIRYSDILSTTIRGVTRITGETWTVGVGGETGHTLAHTLVKDIKSLTVDGANYYFLRDYTMNWNTGVITWNTPLTAGQVVLITYDYGSSDHIQPDLARDDLTLTSFPRISIELTSIHTIPFGIGGINHLSDMIFTITVFVPANKDSNVAGGFGGMGDLSETHRLIRDAIRTNAKLFYSFPWITPLGVNPAFKGKNDKVLQQGADYVAKFRVE